MTRNGRLALFAVVSMIASHLTAQGTPAPRIFSVGPNSGPTTGGTVVTITGENFRFPPGQCFQSCDVLVNIGFSTAEIIEQTAERIVVRTLPNPAGTYDVLVGRNADLAFTTASNAFTYGQTDYERILLPVVVREPLPGAFGSRWASEFVVGNMSRTPLRVSQRPETPCPTPCPEQVPAHSQQSIVPEPPIPGGGTFVYIPKSQAASLNLRIQDLSRQAQTWGTEIQTVREKELTSGATQLLNIPGGDRFRQTLRIYDFDVYSGATLLLTLFPQTGDTPIASRSVTFPAIRPGIYPDFPMHPAMLQIDLTEMFPELRTQERARLIIGPITSSRRIRYWSFISVTNNETQHVTTITPQ